MQLAVTSRAKYEKKYEKPVLPSADKEPMIQANQPTQMKTDYQKKLKQNLTKLIWTKVVPSLSV